jgi:hypothetical protein
VSQTSRPQPSTLRIPLAAEGTSAQIVPKKSAIRTGQGKVEIYQIAAGSNDVMHIDLALGGAELQASLDQVAAGSAPADLLLFDSTDGLRVLVVNSGAPEIAVLDPGTGSGFSVPLAAWALRITPLTGADGRARAVLTPGGIGNYFDVIDLLDLPKKKGKALRHEVAGASFGDLLVADGQILLRHGGAGGLTLYDPVERRFTTFSGIGDVRGLRATPGRVWVLGTASGKTLLASIDLADLHATSLVLGGDAEVAALSALALVGGKGVAAVGCNIWHCRLAWFAGGELSASAMTWLEDFELSGLLTEGAKEAKK